MCAVKTDCVCSCVCVCVQDSKLRKDAETRDQSNIIIYKWAAGKAEDGVSE